MRRWAAAILSCALAISCAPQDDRPSIVVVLVDQLRKDSFDRWAKRSAALAHEGVVFENMRSAAPWTYPSVVSLMSGLYPQQHGADGHATKPELSYFSPEVPLLQGTLRSHGFRTAAFVTNPFLREWNPFHLGFDHFDAEFIHNVGNIRPFFAEYARPKEMFSPAVNRAIREHYDAEAPAGPEFTYVHYIDVHGPWIGAPFDPDYEASVRFLDARIVELYEYFLERYEGRLLFFVTSDHGRSIGDDRVVGYGRSWRVMKESVHDFNLHIPFAVLPSAAMATRASVDVLCSNVDFVPTLLDLLGIEAPRDLPGRSLAPYIRGETPAADAERAIYARHTAFGRASDALIHGGRKYVRFFNPVNGNLRQQRIFDLTADPRETRSLGDDFGPAAPLLNEAAGTHGLSFDATFEPLPEDVEEGLRALGYLDESDEE